jgi:hypothetical protein
MAADLQDMTIKEVAILHEDDPANEGALVELKKRLDPNAAIDEAKRRFKKRMAKAEGKFYADLAKVKAGKPIAKKRKRKKTLAVDEDQILTGEKQPNKLGPSAHSAPSTYPLGKALSDVSASREAELQRQADNYCRQALAKGSTTPGRFGVDHQANLSAYDQHRKENLFDRSREMNKNWRGDGPVVGARKHNVAFSPSYEVMMKAAQDRYDLDPGKSIAQHFSDIYQSREFAALAKADREFERAGRLDGASAALAKRGGRTIPAAESLSDDRDDLDSADETDGFDDDPEADNADARGDRGEPSASSVPSGRSSGTYQNTGHNVAQNSRMAPAGATEPSYSPTRRPSSATRR